MHDLMRACMRVCVRLGPLHGRATPQLATHLCHPGARPRAHAHSRHHTIDVRALESAILSAIHKLYVLLSPEHARTSPAIIRSMGCSCSGFSARAREGGGGLVYVRMRTCVRVCVCVCVCARALVSVCVCACLRAHGRCVYRDGPGACARARVRAAHVWPSFYSSIDTRVHHGFLGAISTRSRTRSMHARILAAGGKNNASVRWIAFDESQLCECPDKSSTTRDPIV